jgi:TonB family protein
MKVVLTSTLLILIVNVLSAQDTLTIYYKKNDKPTRKINKSEYYRKVINTGDRYYFQEFLTESDKLVQESEIKSWEPLIEHGKTTYFDKLSEQPIASGYYQNGTMSGKWVYKTTRGYDTTNYSIAKIKYSSKPNLSNQETFLIVEKMPFFDYGSDLKKKREILDKKISRLNESGNIQNNHEKYMNLQKQIIQINKQAFDRYKGNSLYYPLRAKREEIQGTVYLQFVVDKTGKIVETEILEGVDKDLDKEAVRLINSMENWTVGIQKGKSVRVAMTVGVKFEL